jgi:hypothetical protein
LLGRALYVNTAERALWRTRNPSPVSFVQSSLPR